MKLKVATTVTECVLISASILGGLESVDVKEFLKLLQSQHVQVEADHIDTKTPGYHEALNHLTAESVQTTATGLGSY